MSYATKYAKLNLLYRLSEYHEDIEVFRKSFASIGGSVVKGNCADATALFKKFVDKNINEHFEFEEKVVFPIVSRKSKSLSRTIVMFVGIHHQVHKSLKIITTFFHERGETRRLNSECMASIAQLFLMLENHAADEWKNIAPLLLDDSTKILIGRLWLNFWMERRRSSSKDERLSTTIKSAAKPIQETKTTKQSARTVPKIYISEEKHLVSEEGYEVYFAGENQVIYKEKERSVKCPVDSSSSTNSVVHEKDIVQWESPITSAIRTDIQKTIITMRINMALQKLR